MKLFLSFVMASFFISCAYAQKTDTIIHINGNILTGEIKRLDFGIVTYKMDGMGTINYQMDKIRTMKSNKNFEIRLSNGFNYFGNIDTVSKARKVKLVLSNSYVKVPVDSIVEMYPIKNNFWLRLNGKFSMGFNFDKGSQNGKINFSGNLNYLKQRSEFSLTWNNNLNFLTDSVTSSKEDVTLNFKRDLKRRWSSNLIAGANQNSELGLDLRLFLSALVSYDLVNNNRNVLFFGTGLSTNREWSNGDSVSINNQEIFFTLNYKIFKYSSPKIDVSTNITAYPSLSTKGRLRAEYNLNSRIELFNDFFFGITYYYSLDTKPVNNDASNQDWGISTNISYSFH